MEKLKKKRVLFLLVLCMVVLIGCTRTRIIDKISIVHVFGFDQAENGDLIGTALFPDYTASKSGDVIQYLDEQAPTTTLLVSKMAEHTSTPIKIPKIRVILLGKDYAKAGVKEVVDRLILTPQLGTNIQIAVSTHSAKETLNIFKKEKSLTLAERIQQNMQGQHLPRMNLHIFLNQFYGEGMDAYVPMLTVDKKDRITIEGIGVFKGDKLKLDLNRDQSVLFSFLKDNRTQAIYKINLKGENDPENTMVVRSFQSKQNWNWDKNKEELHLDLKLRMSLTQFPDKYDVENRKHVKEMEKFVEKKIKKGIEDLLATFKENEVDPIGIGNIVRSKDVSWKEESFYRQYPTLPIHVDVNIEIIHSGLEG